MKKILFLASLLLMLSFYQLRAQTQKIQPLITGGRAINITEAPWQVFLTANGNFVCGGIIVAPNFILTARHCVAERSPNSVQVVAGVTCRTDANSSNTLNVSRIILHPDPNIDAALLELSSYITFNSSRQAVNHTAALNSALYHAGNRVRTSGWGWTIPNVGNSSANCLQAVDLDIISNQSASTVLRPTWGRDLRPHEMAVIGRGSIRQGACHGDSGGPLTIQPPWSNSPPVLIGIVQGGIPGCGGSNHGSPSVFVRVSHISNWISSNVPTIIGPTILCGSEQREFFIENLPAGATSVTWSSIHLTCVGGNCTTPVVNGRSSIMMTRRIDRTAYVEATINFVSGATVALPRKQVVAGIPLFYNISSTHEWSANGFCLGDSFEERITYRGEELIPGNSHRITDIEWIGTNTGLTPIGAPSSFGVSVFRSSIMSRSSLQINAFNPNGFATIHVRARNQCGWSGYKTIYYQHRSNCPSRPGGPIINPQCPICFPNLCSCLLLPPIPDLPRSVSDPLDDGVIAFPNPVSNVLTIDLTQATTNAFENQTTSEAVFNVRLFNAHGMIVRQQRTKAATIQFDVSNLPEGTYYLHIEHNGEIEKHQIIVQRN